MRARRPLVTVGLVLLVVISALALVTSAMGPTGSLQEIWEHFVAQWPEPPVGALLFAAVGWWLLTRRRRVRKAKIND